MNKEELFFDVTVIGSGMGALTTACLLAKEGYKVAVLEQNYLPGGCTSSYWRKGFVFESGATTLVGLDKNMPLQYLLKELSIEIQPIHLQLPMQVYLKDGRVLKRYENLDQWIEEAENVFGRKNQRKFWELCYKLSRFVWETSLKQTSFPPTSFGDLWKCAINSDLSQFRYAGYAFFSMKSLLKKYDLLENTDFVDFVNEQLLITAQNDMGEVNMLFGATALCYTNYANYYMPGGLINLVNPLVDYLKSKGSEVFLRTSVEKVRYEINDHIHQFTSYIIETDKGTFVSNLLVSGIPINNTLKIYDDDEGRLDKKYKKSVLGSEKLNSAFQMGIGFRKEEGRVFEAIHHQIHLPEPLPGIGSHSIFLSLSHPDDFSRCDDPTTMVASVSTHIANPASHVMLDKKTTEDYILKILEERGFLKRENIVYQHSSSQKSWEKWTGREYGFVGGYPQWMGIKPWQMLDARLDNKKAYICGDTVYPGQGIPGTVLSGIIAYQKMKRDWNL